MSINQKWRNYSIKLLVRQIIVVLCFLVCFVAPSFTDFIGFVGSFQFMMLGMVIPPIVYFYCKQNSLGKIGKFLQIGYILLTIFLWVMATVVAVQKLAKKDE